MRTINYAFTISTATPTQSCNAQNVKTLGMNSLRLEPLSVKHLMQNHIRTQS